MTAQEHIYTSESRFDFKEHFHYKPLDNLDNAQNIFFQRELEHIIPEMFEFEQAMINARKIFPIDRGAGGAVNTITWRQFRKYGRAQVTADYANDINVVNAEGEEFHTGVESVTAAAVWSIQEIRQAQREGRPLDRMYSEAARRAMLTEENQIAFQGFGANIFGLASAGTGIAQTPVPNGSWATATPDDILEDLNFVANTIVETTGDVEIPDTMIMPTSDYNSLTSTARSANSDTTILAYFLANNPYIREVIPVRELEDAFGGLGPVVIAYRRDPSKIRMQVPLDIEQFAPQEENLTVKVIWHMRVGGLTIHKPGSLLIGTGI